MAAGRRVGSPAAVLPQQPRPHGARALPRPARRHVSHSPAQPRAAVKTLPGRALRKLRATQSDLTSKPRSSRYMLLELLEPRRSPDLVARRRRTADPDGPARLLAQPMHVGPARPARCPLIAPFCKRRLAPPRRPAAARSTSTCWSNNDAYAFASRRKADLLYYRIRLSSRVENRSTVAARTRGHRPDRVAASMLHGGFQSVRIPSDWLSAVVARQEQGQQGQLGGAGLISPLSFASATGSIVGLGTGPSGA